jgi:type III restriction enzyme
VDYLKPSAAIGFYHPDWLVVQKARSDEIFWIMETKGCEWEGTAAKDSAMTDWCRKVSNQIGKPWRFIRINQSQIGDIKQFASFADLVAFAAIGDGYD